MSPNTPVVAGQDLQKNYRSPVRTRRLPWPRADERDVPTVTAVDDVSVTIARNEVVSVAGPSGSGKSTLLHLLAGLETPTSGQVVFDGTNLADRSERERTQHRLHHVGIVFQRFHLFDAFSARANVALPLVEAGIPRSERRTRAEQLLEEVGLGDRTDHPPPQLSGGERQRVAIARALINDPELVIADEPTGELDTETGERILDLFGELVGGRAVVIASHDSAVHAIADRTVQLRDGTRVDDDAADTDPDS